MYAELLHNLQLAGICSSPGWMLTCAAAVPWLASVAKVCGVACSSRALQLAGLRVGRSV